MPRRHIVQANECRNYDCCLPDTDQLAAFKTGAVIAAPTDPFRLETLHLVP
jgi:hypothetical protein